MRALLLVCLGLACTGGPPAPTRIAWDRDTCHGCSMAISDHHYAAEIRGGPKGHTEKFDDIGCALRWLDQQPWAAEPGVSLWVADHEDGRWLDARTAWYSPGARSPMGFNFAASTSAAGISFEDLRVRLRSTVSRETKASP